jgi:hypothetical protein
VGALFGTPDIPQPPQEDPEVKRLRDLEQRRAEADRLRATQDQLAQETSVRSVGRGVSSLTRRRELTSLLGSG